jgi:RNA polymerase sigma-70 factor, ECF subfamily
VTTLVHSFRSALADASAWSAIDDAALEPVLAAHLAASRAVWPAIDVDDAVYGGRLARVVAEPTLAALERLHASDLYLACACATGDPAALAAFEAAYFDEVDHAARRTRAGDALAIEIKQRLRRILFVAEPPRPAAIAEFAGRGDLRGWVRVAATRDLIHALKREKRDVHLGDDQLLDMLAPQADPELGYIGELYREPMIASVRAAFAALPARERRLLRLAMLEGLTIDELGTLHAVHRATAARWVAGARELVLARTREELAKRLGASAAEVESIIRLVHERVDVSLERLLASKQSR